MVDNLYTWQVMMLGYPTGNGIKVCRNPKLTIMHYTVCICHGKIFSQGSSYYAKRNVAYFSGRYSITLQIKILQYHDIDKYTSINRQHSMTKNDMFFIIKRML